MALNNIYSLDMWSVLKSNLLEKLKTGNEVLDNIIVFVLLSSHDRITSTISTLGGKASASIYILYVAIKRYILKQNNTAKSITIKNITNDNNINTLYKSVHWYLTSVIKYDANDDLDLSIVENTKTLREVPSVNSDITFQDKKINYKFDMEIKKVRTDKTYERDNHFIVLSVDCAKDSTILKDFAAFCNNEYAKYIELENTKKKIYKHDKDNWKGEILNNKRKMETVFLRKNIKEELLRIIDDFVVDDDEHRGKKYYEFKGINYTLGILLKGVPGTGKTSFIVALANYINRSIYSIRLSMIKTNTQLLKLFDEIDHKKSIIVFEDVDCAEISHKRAEVEPQSQPQSQPMQPIQMQPIQMLQSQEDKKDEDKLTLDILFELIDDNVGKRHGGIIIFTTNHPEKLDPALFRDRRMDIVVEFTYCDLDQLKKIYFNFFNNDELAEQLNELKETDETIIKRNINPAKISQICLNNRHDYKKAISDIVALLG